MKDDTMTLKKFREECESVVGGHAKLLVTPPKEINADLALPCFSLSKELKKAPQEIAASLAKEFLKKKLTLIKEIRAEGPYVNFYADWSRLSKEIIAESSGKDYGKGAEKRKIVVEFAHPNTHKLFHIGHLRNIMTGESISRLLEALGNKVYRVNYQGDVGLHIAKALWGIGKLGFKEQQKLSDKIEFLAQAYVLGNKAYEDGSAKSEIDDINKKLYEKDPDLLKLWETTKAWSLQYFDEI